MSRQTRLVINAPSVIYDVQGGEAVLIDLSTGRYYRLDAASTRLWEHFSGAVSPEQLVASAENSDALSAEIERIVEELREQGLVREATDADPAAPAPSPWTFDGFALEQFTDLEDILGLDPIHEVDPQRGWPHASNE